MSRSQRAIQTVAGIVHSSLSIIATETPLLTAGVLAIAPQDPAAIDRDTKLELSYAFKVFVYQLTACCGLVNLDI